MKKILLGIAACSLILTSCQKSEVVDDINNENNQLNFGVYQGKATRASELMNADLKINSTNFPLYAYQGKLAEEEKPYFEEILTYGVPTTGKWNTTIPRFLTDSDPLQFYAYYAAGGTTPGVIPGAVYKNPVSYAGTTYPTLEYTIQAPATPDLVAARINDHTGTSVVIQLRHILSQVNFGVRGYYGAKINITDININKVFNDGTFSFGPAPANWNWTRKTADPLIDYLYPFNGFTTPGGVKEADGSWTNPNDESKITYIFGDGGNWGPGQNEFTWYVTDATTAVSGDGITTKLSNSLILMPQALKAGITEAYITFKYTIRDLEDKYIAGTETNPIEGRFDLNMNGKNPVYADEWKPNMRYVYTIDFTNYLDNQKLTFDVDVEAYPWENYDVVDENNPGTGIVLVSSLAKSIFMKEIRSLAVGATYDVVAGHALSDVEWDWSPFAMTETFNAGNVFNVTFTKVLFNGHKITVTPPSGFIVTDGTTTTNGTTVTSIEVKKTDTTLTFTKQ